MSSHPAHLGVLAFGDSITNGGGELQWGVALQSWALWTARALGLPYSGYAVDGADVRGVVEDQMAAFAARATSPEGPYDLGCLYVGVNDVRSPEWDPAGFDAAFQQALAFLAPRCERVLTATAPLRLGRPRAGAASVSELNAIIRRAAAATGALVVDLSDFGARDQVMVDHVHPTAFGQIAIARRTLTVLAADGMAIRVDPAALVDPRRSRGGALRGDAAYVYRDLKQRARAATLRACGRLRAARRSP